MLKSLTIAALLPAALCGPVEFGLAEVRRAMEARSLGGASLRFRTEITSDPPETFRIQPGLITGGDLRGLMYGLLEAAWQIRTQGRLAATRGAPATPMRGIRYFLHNEDLEKDWYYSRDYWREYFQMLARCRFNRFNLVFAHQTAYLAPPYPFWISLSEFPGVRAHGLSAGQQKRNLETLRFISQTAAEYGIDFTLGIWEHNIQPGMKPSVDGLTERNIGPYSFAALKRILRECPAIRSVQMRTNSESGIPRERQVEFYREWIFRALREAGRLVTLDLRGWLMQPEMLSSAVESGVPVRLSTKYWSEDLGRPYPPAETFPNYSYFNFLERPRPYDFYFELWGLGSHRLLLWGDPEYVRRAVGTFRLSGALGFEIDPPLAQKGFGNAPGKWGIFTAREKARVFWKHEFERYWLFYLLWGRLSYDPKAADRVWKYELERRFPGAAEDVLEAYRASSGVLNEIVAAHLADPNMYIWPEINPGGLIEAYRETPPSDFRFVLPVAKAVENRIKGVASAAQTPFETATLLDLVAGKAEAAVGRARKKLAAVAEWRSSEPDFLVLATLGHYHARRQKAADQLTYFYETGDGKALAAARSELQEALGLWEKIVDLTDGVYPAQMAFGPHDAGHWKDKLPWVQHDLKLIAEREAIFKRFGRFLHGFDFGEKITSRKGASWQTFPYVGSNNVEPRFKAVDPDTTYTAETGHGWVGEGKREAAGKPLASYRDLRASQPKPEILPENALFGDAIAGVGPQTFRVRTGEGRFRVHLLLPDQKAITRVQTARAGLLDIATPDGEWKLSGLVIESAEPSPAPPPQRWPRRLPRPMIRHTPPREFVPAKPLVLSIAIAPSREVATVRLHYRAVNQLLKFKTIEAAPSKSTFTIPAADLPDRWDFMYYFEILNSAKTGWLEPDPAVATPYYVVPIALPKPE